MKRFVTRSLFFFVTLLICYSLSAQDYEKMVIEGNSWSIVNWTQAGFFTDYYVIKGDTIIDSINYKKVFQTDDSTFQDLGWYRGALREDTISKEVFHVSENQGEQAIYKFNLKIGDTVGIYSNSCGPMTISVADVDTIIDLNGIERKRFSVEEWMGDNLWFGEYWVEGIGSLSGLLNTFNWDCVADFNQEMLCFSSNDVLTYMNPEHNECYISSLSVEEQFEISTIIIYPNPVTKTSKIIHKSDIRISSLTIFNSSGFLVSESNNTNPKIEKGNHTPGIYFLKVELENGDMVTSRFVIK